MPTKWKQLISTKKLTLPREDETWQFQNSKTCAANYLKSRLSRSNGGFWGKEKTGKTRNKTLGAEKRTNHKLKSDSISDWSKPELDPRPYCWKASAFITAPSKSPDTHTKRNIYIESECFASYLFLPFGFSFTWFNIHKRNRQCLEKVQIKLN